MDVQQMLDQRHSVFLEWVNPVPAVDEHGDQFTACIYNKATVDNCIGMARQSALAESRMPYRDDKESLLDFIATMWAAPLEEI